MFIVMRKALIIGNFKSKLISKTTINSLAELVKVCISGLGHLPFEPWNHTSEEFL